MGYDGFNKCMYHFIHCTIKHCKIFQYTFCIGIDIPPGFKISAWSFRRNIHGLVTVGRICPDHVMGTQVQD